MTACEKYHFTGIAGVGMSSVAQAVLASGSLVTGSDRLYDSQPGGQADVSTIRKLQYTGVQFFAQDGSGITPETTALVVSTAIENDNPDLSAARRMGVPVLHRSEMLARLTKGKMLIAVTGTSGKSTVTGMLGCMLSELGAGPTVVNGAPVLNWMDADHIGNVLIGDTDLWVIEADESDRSLLSYKPKWAVITNASADHFSIEETMDLFSEFESNVESGIVSGIGVKDFFENGDLNLGPRGSIYTVDRAIFNVPVPGRHNAENAVLAMKMCELLGYDLPSISSAMAAFRGIHRRLEVVGVKHGVTVIDEYAHNPAKIRAAWETVASGCRNVICVWRPHGFGPLRSMMDELTSTFSDICRADDSLYILPVYDAGGTADRSIGSDELVKRLRAQSVSAELILSENVTDVLSAQAGEGDAVIVMGARDPGLSSMARGILDKLTHN